MSTLFNYVQTINEKKTVKLDLNKISNPIYGIQYYVTQFYRVHHTNKDCKDNFKVKTLKNDEPKFKISPLPLIECFL